MTVTLDDAARRPTATRSSSPTARPRTCTASSSTADRRARTPTDSAATWRRWHPKTGASSWPSSPTSTPTTSTARLLLLQDDALGLRIGDVWFNGWPQVERRGHRRRGSRRRRGPRRAAGRVPDRHPEPSLVEHDVRRAGRDPQPRPAGRSWPAAPSSSVALADPHGAGSPAPGVDGHGHQRRVPARRAARPSPRGSRKAAATTPPPQPGRHAASAGRLEARHRPRRGQRLQHRRDPPVRGQAPPARRRRPRPGPDRRRSRDWPPASAPATVGIDLFKLAAPRQLLATSPQSCSRC